MSNQLTTTSDTIDAVYSDVPRYDAAYEPSVRTELSRSSRGKYTKTTKRHTRTVVTEDVYEDGFSTKKDADLFGSFVVGVTLTLAALMFACFMFLMIGV